MEMGIRGEIVLSLMVAAAISSSGCRRTVPVAELRREMASVVPPESATPIETMERSQSTSRRVIVTYETTLPDEVVADHYRALLTRDGWRFCRVERLLNWGRFEGERQWVFAKGRMQIDVDYLPGSGKVQPRFSVVVESTTRKTCAE
jgi:hypothetical protein